jgi:hypothetical protein
MPDPQEGRVSLNDDLMVYLATSDAILVTTRRYVLNTFQVRLSSG